jgi:flavin reductase (DIM6/NTAB) family NADH-FMN oxidoreductase RutF
VARPRNTSTSAGRKRAAPEFARLIPEQAELRACLGHFATGVTVVTCECDGAVHGVTVNSFTSVSLDPPLVLIALGRETRAAQLLRGRRFTINVLSADQVDYASKFAGRSLVECDLRWEERPHGPRLADCLAYVACRPWKEYDGGDHVLFLGEVHDIDFSTDDPLLFFRGKFRLIGDQQERLLIAPQSGPCAGWWGDSPTFDPMARRGASRGGTPSDHGTENPKEESA